jgi:hypothetical protein
MVAAIGLSLAAFGFYLYLAWRYPAVYWYDPHDRLALRDQILLGRWLPLTQLLIYLVSRVTLNLLVLRGVLAGIGALTVLAMFGLARGAFGRLPALIAAGLLASNLMFAALAIVPYPDVLFLGLMLTALHYLHQPSTPHRSTLGMLALNLACLTRYEGWMLAAIIILETSIVGFKTLPFTAAISRAAKSVAVVSVAPVAWLALGVNTTGGLLTRLGEVIGFEQDRAGTNPFLPTIDPGYLHDFALNFYHLLSWQCGLAIVLAGLAGWLVAIRTSARRLHVQLAAFVLMDWLLLALWRPWDLSNLRQAFLIQSFLILYAGYGLVHLAQLLLNWLRELTGSALWPTGPSWLAGVIAVWMMVAALPQAVQFVAQAQQPDFVIPQQIAAWLAPRAGPDDAIWVLSNDVFPAYALAAYSGRSYDAILDHRYDLQTIQAHLSSAKQVYVVSFLSSSAPLSPDELRLLSGLGGGQLAAQRFNVASAPIWEVSAQELMQIPGTR